VKLPIFSLNVNNGLHSDFFFFTESVYGIMRKSGSYC